MLLFDGMFSFKALSSISIQDWNANIASHSLLEKQLSTEFLNWQLSHQVILEPTWGRMLLKDQSMQDYKKKFSFEPPEIYGGDAEEKGFTLKFDSE